MSNELRHSNTERIEQAPWWAVLVLAYVAGVLSTLAVLMPLAKSPEYSQGHADGFREGFATNKQIHEADIAQAFEAGKSFACE